MGSSAHGYLNPPDLFRATFQNLFKTKFLSKKASSLVTALQTVITIATVCFFKYVD